MDFSLDSSSVQVGDASDSVNMDNSIIPDNISIDTTTLSIAGQQDIFGDTGMNDGRTELFGNKNELFATGFVVITELANKQNINKDADEQLRSSGSPRKHRHTENISIISGGNSITNTGNTSSSSSWF